MPNRDILGIGASAGGVGALRFLAGELAPDLPASVLVTVHLSGQFRSTLDAVLTQAGPLKAGFATDGEPLERGRIYIAPPLHHLLVDGERLRLGIGPRENSARPAIDPMFRSMAVCCGGRSIGVVLTGTLGDGASGLWALKQAGGITVVQDPNDAAFPDMPEAALSRAKPDHLGLLADMPALLQSLVRKPAGPQGPVPDVIRYEVEIARRGLATVSGMDSIAPRSSLSCPDCGGVMWQVEEGGDIRYRCHLGHAYTAELMSIALDENLRSALGVALRALEDRISATHGLYKHASEHGRHAAARSWEGKTRELEEQVKVLRDAIRRIDEIAFRTAQD